MSAYSDKDEAQKLPAEPPMEYQYHWNYGTQLAYDRRDAAKTRKNGIWVYAISMTVIFVACFALLAGALIWNVNTNSNGGVNAVAVTEAVAPATVLIYSGQETGTVYGTGFFIREDGYIATNDHVVNGLDNIQVQLYSGQVFDATYVGGSEPDDLAVLKIKGSGYPTVSIGNSDVLLVGEPAIAIGHPGGSEGSWTTTQGIISSLNRTLLVQGDGYSAEVTMLQTDAPVNPGNSGGPLCNANGEVIAVVTRKLTEYEGIGYAVPINEAMQTLMSLIDGSYRQSASTVARVRPAMGITVSDIAQGQTITYGTQTYTCPHNGVYVRAITSGTGASGQLNIGDVIYEMDGIPVGNMTDLQELLYRYNIGDTVKLKVYRLGEVLEVSIRLGITDQN